MPEAIDAAQAQARAALAAGEHQLTGEAATQLLERFGLRIERTTADAASDAPSEAALSACVKDVAQTSTRPVVDIAVELRDDDNFGPVFCFTAPSADGVSAPLRVYGLPPLNPVLARDIVTRSPLCRLVAPEPALAALTALSQAVCDVKEIVGLSLTLRVYRDHVTVVDRPSDSRRSAAGSRSCRIRVASKRRSTGRACV